MPTLYVENVPKELYKALRERAKANRRSLAKEVISLLESEIPTATELKRRRELLRRIDELAAKMPRVAGEFPDSTELIREDRER